ncbi:Ig-like domain-containing protein [Staphylococcus felis]|uniref:Ig-like domain-containing protein n=1 Tax=Staphylococcus felis TaxID=46127 RepID=UPI003967A7C2
MKKLKKANKLDFGLSENSKSLARNLTRGTVSLLIGLTLVFGISHEAEAAEKVAEDIKPIDNQTTNESSQTIGETATAVPQETPLETSTNSPSNSKTESTSTEHPHEPTQGITSSQEDGISSKTTPVPSEESTSELPQTSDAPSQEGNFTNTSTTPQNTSPAETTIGQESQTTEEVPPIPTETQSVSESNNANTEISNEKASDATHKEATSNTKLSTSEAGSTSDIPEAQNADKTTLTKSLKDAPPKQKEVKTQSSPRKSHRLASRPASATKQQTGRKSYIIPDDRKYLYLLRDLGYDALTVKERTQLRFAGISQMEAQTTSHIHLVLTKWLDLKNEFTRGGKIHLSFRQEKFFKAIEGITINGVRMETTNNGQDWSASVSGSTVKSGLIGVVTNTPVVITLKNNQTLESLGFSYEHPVHLTHTWTTNSGEIAAESIQQTTITPQLNLKAPKETRLTSFVSGRMINWLRYQHNKKTIYSVHIYKPDQSFWRTDYGWVLYIKEHIPKKLLPYIDTSSIKLYVSDEFGNPISNDKVITISIGSDGLVDTSKVPQLSIEDDQSISHWKKVRTELNSKVFFGLLGQSRAFTIAYKLRDDMNMEDVVEQINKNHPTSSEARLSFASWLESDYLDSRILGKKDGGAPHERLFGSYATSYMDFYDYDNVSVAPNPPTINDVEAGSKVISGTGVAGNQITVTLPGGTKETTTVGADGTWTVTVTDTEHLNDSDVVSAIQNDGQNDSAISSVTVKDTIAPNTPLINAVEAGATQISGQGENSALIIVTFPDGTMAFTRVDENGNWTVHVPSAVPKLTVGDKIMVISVDNASNKSEETSITVEDQTAPDAPTVDPVTSKATVIMGTGEAGSTVTVTFPDGTTTTGKVNGEGRYEVKIPDTAGLKGGETIKVTLTDEAGNQSEATSITVEDQTAPEAPTVDSVTSKATVITGTGEAGSTVTVTFPNGTTTTGTVNEEGRYEVKIPDTAGLKGGETIKVTLTDEAGNQSEATSTTVEDQTAPDAPTVDPVTSKATIITGTGEAGSKVTVKFPDGTTVTGTVDEAGRYEVKIPDTAGLKGGKTIKVTLTDEAGNQSEATTTTVEDQTAPDAPTVDPVTSKATVITGTGEAGSTVTVTFPDGTTATGTVNEEGRYEVKIPDTAGLKGGETIKVTLTDSSGNVSKPTVVVVTQDHSGMQNKPPKTDGPTSPGTSGTVITGTGKPGSTVTVAFPGGSTSTGTVNEEGRYEVKVPSAIDTEGMDIHKVKVSITTGNRKTEHDSDVRIEQKEINELPETGVESNPSMTLIGSLMTIFGGLLLLLFKRRKNKVISRNKNDFVI